MNESSGAPEIAQVLQSPFDDLVGLQFDSLERGRVTAHLDVDGRHHQPFGIVHGGVYATIIETVASVGAHVVVTEDGRTAVGVHNSADFIRPHAEGRLRAVAEAVHLGRTQHLWQVAVTRDTDGKMVARGQVRLSILDGGGEGGARNPGARKTGARGTRRF